MFRIEYLSFEIQRRATSIIRENLSISKNPLLIIAAKGDKQYLVAQFTHFKTSITKLPNHMIQLYSNEIKERGYICGLSTFTSSYAGAGKTFQIRTESFKIQSNYIPVTILHSNDIINKILSSLKNQNISQSMDYIALHLDIYDTANDSLNPILFDLIFLGGFDDNRTGNQYFWNPELTSIFIELATGNLCDKLRVCLLLPQIHVKVNSERFCNSKQSLLQGMGEKQFQSLRNDGTIIDCNNLFINKSIRTKKYNAFERLQYVCIGLDIMDNNNGNFPYVQEKENISPLDSLRDSQNQQYIKKSTSNKLTSSRCFELLSKYLEVSSSSSSSADDNCSLSLWCLWNFVNVFYWQLRDMHHPESPINCACMPDPSIKKDVAIKSRYKGLVVKYLIRTAREFATRQQKKEDKKEIGGLYISGMTKSDDMQLNGFYTVLDDLVCGKPAFRKKLPFFDVYVYYRASKNQWVFDDCIDIDDDSSFGFCEKGDNIDGLWTSVPGGWVEDKNIKVSLGSHPDGYNGECVNVSGVNVSVNGYENGIYLRQPEYDNINNKPHYIKIIDASKGLRRHLYHEKTNGWVICPKCTMEEGAFCMSNAAAVDKQWKVVPPDVIEDRATFIIISKDDINEYKSKIESYENCTPRDRDDEKKSKLVLRESKVSFDDHNQSSDDHDDIDDENEEGATMELLWDNTLKWNDSNHECVLFSNKTHVVSFLSLNSDRLRKGMEPGLYKHLVNNQINVGEDLDQLSSKFYEILAALTEVNKTEEEAKQIMDGKYCLTGDNLLKMLAIFARLRCGVPVVLMGECGCGKTMLVKYLCEWMDVKLLILDVHGGTSENDIISIFKQASNYLNEEKENNKSSNTLGSTMMNSSKIFVFLDEINTCSHMGLLCEVICHRTIYGERIPDDIFILAALNPYRRRPEQDTNSPGLLFNLTNNQSDNTKPSNELTSAGDLMSSLVYRVHPIPHTLRDFIFDFGALTPDMEKLYILSMVRDKDIIHYDDITTNQSDDLDDFIIQHIASLIHYSQQYIRKIEKDDSSASLRDVRRCLNLISWFYEFVEFNNNKNTSSNEDKNESKTTKLSKLACSTILALAFVYYYRLNTTEKRENYLKEIGSSNISLKWKSKSNIESCGFGPLAENNGIIRLIHHFQKFISSQVIVEDGIAMNDALMENLFVVIICILTRIPIFVVGKPGSSKTLTLQVIASNLQGKQSPMEFWRKYPAIYIFPYQCSPMSDSHSIQHQFDMAVNYQANAENTITVLLLDEVGLAEHSPDMPLKVLHAMLVDPPISVVGLSNWVLDPAKMNRAILLQRTEPSKDDIKLTGQSIITSSNNKSNLQQYGNKILDKYLQPLANAYHKIYTQQKGRDFIGMRDYYNLVKLLRSHLSKQGRKAKFTSDILTFGLARNFGGKRELIHNVLHTFHEDCFKSMDNLKIPIITDLIQANIHDPSSRHLMILTKNSSALSLLFGCEILNERTTKILVGSEFKDDKNELHLITQINQVKLAMAEGSNLILLNHDNIYEALYDVLNQRYLFKKDAKGNVKKMLRLAIGSRSQLCTVADGFKIIVIVEQTHAYRNLDLPLLNRFEKQLLCPDDVLGPKQKKIVDEINIWCNDILSYTGLSSMQDIFCGFHPATISTAVLCVSNYNDDDINESTSYKIKNYLSKIARPIAVMNSKILKSISPNYFKDHSSLSSLVEKSLFSSSSNVDQQQQQFGSMCFILTHSPISHLEDSLKNSTCKKLNSIPHEIIQIGELTSERQVYKFLNDFYSNNDSDERILFIQCDPIGCSQSLINHTRFICTKERSQYEYNLSNQPSSSSFTKHHVIFLTHLPPGTKQRSRFFALDFMKPWDYYFIDDLRNEEIEGNTTSYLTNSVYDLIKNGSISLSSIYKSKFQHALSSCKNPETKNPFGYFGRRIKILQYLILKSDRFNKFIEESLMKTLENTKKFVPLKQKQQQQQQQHDNNTNDDNMIIDDQDEIAKVPCHVKMVCEDLLGGSLRQSLDLAIQIIIVQALAHILHFIDCNFNLSSVFESEIIDFDNLTEKNKNSILLWFSLLESDVIVDKFALGITKIGEESFVRPIQVLNTGQYESLVTKFPFSYKIISILNSSSIKDQIEKQEQIHDKVKTFNNLIQITFGNEITNLIEKYGNENFSPNYLHDYVSIASHHIPGSKFKSIYKLYEKILTITRLDSLKSIGGIHTCIWENETRIFRCSSLISNNRIPKHIRKNLLQSICSFELPKNLLPFSSSIHQIDIENRLASLDFYILNELLSNYWNRIENSFSNFDSFHFIVSFINEFSSIRSDIELYILSLSKYNENSSPYDGISLINIQESFLGIRIFHIYLQEIIYPILLRDISIKTNHCKNIIQSCKNISISSIEYVKELFENSKIILFEDNYHYAISFIRRYIQEIIFGEQEGFYNISYNKQLSNEFCNSLEKIFIGNTNIKEFDILIDDLPIRRAILRCLHQYNYNLILQGNESLQLYLQYYCDLFSEIKLWNVLNDNDNDCTMITSDDIQLAILNLYDSNEFINQNNDTKKLILSSLAKIHACILNYSKKIILEFSSDNGPNFNNLFLQFNNLHDILYHSVHKNASKYALKCIKSHGGVDTLALVVNQKELDWLPIDRDDNTEAKIILPDPFVWLADNKHIYEQVCGALRSCATQTSNQFIQLNKLNLSEIPEIIFGGALYSQIATERGIIFEKQTKALKKWINDSFTSNHQQSIFFNWLLSQCKNFDKFLPLSSLDCMCLLQFTVNLGLWSVCYPKSWICNLLFNGKVQKKSFLIAVPDDEFAAIAAISGHVGWYICPNGHKYSVGQCTMPMQKALCPECGAQIGGSNHISVRGVKKLNDVEVRGEPERGYSISTNETDTVRHSKLEGRFLRLILHLLLLTSCSINEENIPYINELLLNRNSSDNKKQEKQENSMDIDDDNDDDDEQSSSSSFDVFEFLSRCIRQDWKILKQLTSLSDSDLVLCCHLVLRKLREDAVVPQELSIFENTFTRNIEETKITKAVEFVFSNAKLKSSLEQTRNSLQDDNTTASIRFIMGEKLWYEIHEEQFSNEDKKTVDPITLLWRYREPVSFQNFSVFWNLQTEDTKKRLPLLKILLEEEEKLPSIRGISDVLEWHSIIFENLPHMSISRTQAMEITNQDIINKISSDDDRKYAFDVFNRFSRIFNAVLPTIELLFGCDKNPFIKDGVTNLGGGQQMNLNIPIAFSLPSMITGSDQGNFASGMCTIRILETLVDTQNEVLRVIEKNRTSRRANRIKRRNNNNNNTSTLPTDNIIPLPVREDIDDTPAVPAVNYRTPSKVLNKQLIIYDREKDLLPLLRIFSDQPLHYGHGGELAYHLEKIESSLANGLLAGKRAINLCITHYHFSGDVKRMGQLPLLKKKINQDPQLPSSLKETISSEVDTQNCSLRLMQILEICIQFIVSLGSSSNSTFDGSTSLSSFVLNTVHISQDEWDEIGTTTIKKQICLKHIEALYLLLESQLNCNPMDDVLDVYCVHLTPELETSLLNAIPKLDFSVLLSELRNMLINQLTTTTVEISPETSLKEVLGTWLLLNEEPWFEHFPEGLNVAHIKEVYLLLSSHSA